MLKPNVGKAAHLCTIRDDEAEKSAKSERSGVQFFLFGELGSPKLKSQLKEHSSELFHHFPNQDRRDH
jgi:hypothetical protein